MLLNLEQDSNTVWDGVKNPLALKHQRAMEVGDLALIYHTGKERQIVGVAKISSKFYADPALDDVKRVVVDVQAKRKLPLLVTLAKIKQDANWENFDLLRLRR